MNRGDVTLVIERVCRKDGCENAFQTKVGSLLEACGSCVQEEAQEEAST